MGRGHVGSLLLSTQPLYRPKMVLRNRTCQLIKRNQLPTYDAVALSDLGTPRPTCC